MCTGCFKDLPFHKIDMKHEYHPYNVGSCKFCNEVVCEMDDMIIDSIIILNKKGYNTQFCCSGHLSEKFITTYIKFVENPQTAPIGFRLDGDCIRYPLSKLGVDGFEQILNANLEIYKWATSLPNKEMSVVNGSEIRDERKS